MVQDLIDHQTRTWNMEILQFIFYIVDTKRITTTHLSFDSVNDPLVWLLDKNGKFSIKSIHSITIKLDEESLNSSSRHQQILTKY